MGNGPQSGADRGECYRCKPLAGKGQVANGFWHGGCSDLPVMKGTAHTPGLARVDAEEGANMQTLQRMAVTAVFTLTCFTVPVLTASAAGASVESSGVATIQRPTTAATGDAPGKPDDAGKPDTVVVPDWSKGAMAEQLRQLQDQFKKEQKDLIARYQELLKRARDVSQEERAKVRELFRIERDTLIETQKELRDQVKASFEEFRKEHAEHRDLIDAAKEKAKERVKQRRGQGDGE